MCDKTQLWSGSLGAGDFIYLPAGASFNTESQEEKPSLHLTLKLDNKQANWNDLLKIAFGKIVDQLENTTMANVFDSECQDKLRRDLVTVAREAADEALKKAICQKKAEFISLR